MKTTKPDLSRLQSKLDRIHRRIARGSSQGVGVRAAKWKKTQQKVVLVSCMCGCCSTRIWPGKGTDPVGIETKDGILTIYRSQLSAILDL